MSNAIWNGFILVYILVYTVKNKANFEILLKQASQLSQIICHITNCGLSQVSGQVWYFYFCHGKSFVQIAIDFKIKWYLNYFTCLEQPFLVMGGGGISSQKSEVGQGLESSVTTLSLLGVDQAYIKTITLALKEQTTWCHFRFKLYVTEVFRLAVQYI